MSVTKERLPSKRSGRNGPVVREHCGKREWLPGSLQPDTPRTRTAALHGLPTNGATESMKNPPARLPSRIAAIPSISIKPTASPTFSPASSFAIPHRAGDIIADCRPRRKKPPTARGSECRNAAPKSTIITASCSQRLARHYVAPSIAVGQPTGKRSEEHERCDEEK